LNNSRRILVTLVMGGFTNMQQLCRQKKMAQLVYRTEISRFKTGQFI